MISELDRYLEAYKRGLLRSFLQAEKAMDLVTMQDINDRLALLAKWRIEARLGKPWLLIRAAYMDAFASGQVEGNYSPSGLGCRLRREMSYRDFLKDAA